MTFRSTKIARGAIGPPAYSRVNRTGKHRFLDFAHYAPAGRFDLVHGLVGEPVGGGPDKEFQPHPFRQLGERTDGASNAISWGFYPAGNNLLKYTICWSGFYTLGNAQTHQYFGAAGSFNGDSGPSIRPHGGSGQFIRYWHRAANDLQTGQSFSTGQFVRIIGTNDPDDAVRGQRLYVNGEFETSGPGVTAPTQLTSALLVTGAYNVAGSDFGGWTDSGHMESRIYLDYAFTDEDAAYDYQNWDWLQATRTYSLPSEAPEPPTFNPAWAARSTITIGAGTVQ